MKHILEKLTDQEQVDYINNLDAKKIIDDIFLELKDREKDILLRRFGLKNNKIETLEQIGNLYKLTRERVRQIEAASIAKIKKIKDLEERLYDLKVTVLKLLEEHGGLLKREYLLNILSVIPLELGPNVIQEESIVASLKSKKNKKETTASVDDVASKENLRGLYKNYYDFLLSYLMTDEIELVKNNDKFSISFKLKSASIEYLEDLAEDFLTQVQRLNKTFKLEELLDLVKQLKAYRRHIVKLKKEGNLNITTIFKSKIFPDKAEIINDNKIFYSLLQALKDVARNKYGFWGIKDWEEITPKTINDKIYLVLKNEGKPLHFKKIAERINEMQFDKKKANPATVHNELILDKRYVLVSRGTYGLRAWQKKK